MDGGTCNTLSSKWKMIEMGCEALSLGIMIFKCKILKKHQFFELHENGPYDARKRPKHYFKTQTVLKSSFRLIPDYSKFFKNFHFFKSSHFRNLSGEISLVFQSIFQISGCIKILDTHENKYLFFVWSSISFIQGGITKSR